MVNPSNSPHPEKPEPPLAARLRNFLVALAAIVLSVALFLGFRSETGSVSLTAMAEAAVPLEAALGNDRPTLIEFYANWCTSCQAMAPQLQQLKQTYGDRVNFVMLNVDNTKWLPEVLHYRVDGIPHFVYLDAQSKTVAQAIGEQPQAVIAANLVALVEGTPLPYSQQTEGQTSTFTAPAANPSKSATDPRSHGSQVVN